MDEIVSEMCGRNWSWQAIQTATAAYPCVQILGIDLPTTDRGEQPCCGCARPLHKVAFAFAIPDQKSERIARLLAEEIIPVFGVSEALLSDRGTRSLSDAGG